MSTPAPPFDAALDLLATAELSVLGRAAGSSNLTLVVEATRGDDYAWAIYKPEMGERPLHDFEPGLHARELAAFKLSEYLGWHLVPPTVVRHDAPLGVGSLQWYVEAGDEHYFTLFDEHPATHDALRRMAVFDVLAHNTDRKGGHVLRDATGHVWGIDHGLCFGAWTALRTVIWDFAGEPVPDALLADIERLADEIPEPLRLLLDDAEVLLLRQRVRTLLRDRVLPHPTSPYDVPWPLV